MKKNLTIMLGLLVVVSLLFTGCGDNNNNTADKPIEFNMGHATWIGYAPLYIAEEKGYFEQYNIKPNLLIIEDEAQYAAAITSGQLQGLGNVIDREVIHYAKGAPITFVAAMAESAGADGVIASGDIKTVADLRGKTIGLDKSSTSYFFFLAILDKFGISENDVIIQEMTAGDAGAAFIAGRLDAAVSWEPWLSLAGERDGGHLLASSADYPKTIVDVITLRQDFVEEHPQAVTGLVKAWNEAVAYLEENPEEGISIMAKALQLSEEELAEMMVGVKFFGKEENVEFFQDATDPDSIWGVASLATKFWQEKEIITEEIDIHQSITDIFVNEAAK